MIHHIVQHRDMFYGFLRKDKILYPETTLQYMVDNNTRVSGVLEMLNGWLRHLLGIRSPPQMVHRTTNHKICVTFESVIEHRVI